MMMAALLVAVGVACFGFGVELGMRWERERRRIAHTVRRFRQETAVVMARRRGQPK